MRQNERGYMLVGALLIIVLLFVVGLSLTTLASFSLKNASDERNHQSVYYIAEAGLNHLANKFEKAVSDIYEDETIRSEDDFFQKLEQFHFLKETYDTFEKVKDIQPYAKLSIEKTDQKGVYRLFSTGYIGEKTRTVSQLIKVEWNGKQAEAKYELPPFAVFTSGKFEMNNGRIIGDIGTMNSSIGAVSFPGGGPRLEGKVYVPQGNEEIVKTAHYIKVEVAELDASYQIPDLPPFPEFPSFECPKDETIASSPYNSHQVIKDCHLYINNWIVDQTNYTLALTDNLKFKEMRFTSNYTLRIDVGDKNRAIVVDHLNIQNGHIELLGTGSLTIYVTDKITLGSGSSVNKNGDISRLNIFLKGTGSKHNRKELKIEGSQKIYGSLYAEDADIHFSGGGGFVGNIFTGGKNLIIEGGSTITTQLIFAPQADVRMAGGGNLKGMIVANHFYNTGGATITFEEPFVLTGPISPAALNISGNQPEDGSGGSNIGGTGNMPSIHKGNIREVLAKQQ